MKRLKLIAFYGVAGFPLWTGILIALLFPFYSRTWAEAAGIISFFAGGVLARLWANYLHRSGKEQVLRKRLGLDLEDLR